LKIISDNRKARFDFEVLERLEAGIELTGSEVKSLRGGHCQLKDSYIDIHRGEMYLIGVHISPFQASSYNNHAPERRRRLLMHREQIDRLFGMIREKGVTLIPAKIYFKGPRVKVEVAVVKGKKKHDKREAIKKRDVDRDLQKAQRRGH